MVPRIPAEAALLATVALLIAPASIGTVVEDPSAVPINPPPTFSEAQIIDAFEGPAPHPNYSISLMSNRTPSFPMQSETEAVRATVLVIDNLARSDAVTSIFNKHPNARGGFGVYSNRTDVLDSYYEVDWSADDSTNMEYWVYSYEDLTLVGPYRMAFLPRDAANAGNIPRSWWGGMETREKVDYSWRVTGYVGGQANIPHFAAPSEPAQNVPLGTVIQAAASIWVGTSVDQCGCNGLLQTGVEEHLPDWNPLYAHYQGWHQFFPAQSGSTCYPTGLLSCYTVSHGDRVYMYVSHNPDDSYTLGLQDQTAGTAVSYTTPPYPGFYPSYNQFVIETPVYQSLHAQLPTFGHVDFKDTSFCTVRYSDGLYCFSATDPSVQGGYGVKHISQYISECNQATNTGLIEEGSYYRTTFLNSCYDYSYVT